ncbi:MAG: DUF4215 domain-containing protein, partial [Phycisphaerae bacterium]
DCDSDGVPDTCEIDCLSEACSGCFSGLERCAGGYTGTFTETAGGRGIEEGGAEQGGFDGTVSATLTSEGSLSVTFDFAGGPLFFGSVATVAPDGTISGGAEGVTVAGAFDFDTCSASGTWQVSGEGVVSGIWNIQFAIPAECSPDSNSNGIPDECEDLICGNTVLNPGEECDDGNTTDGDGCDSNCTVTGCGNGIVTAGEECDDGNTASGDGCDATCQDEFCGDNIVNDSPNEQCDDGNTADGDGCDQFCQLEGACCFENIACVENADESECTDNFGVYLGDATSCSTCIICGDAVLDAGEQCDDGNTVSGDGCDAICQDEFCGDNIVNDSPNEECDDGNTANSDGCDQFCQLEGACCFENIACVENADESECTDNFGVYLGDATSCSTCIICGDAVLDAGEQCDDGNTANGDGCDENCLLEAVCGDGVVEGAEECDDGNTTPGDGCDANCQTESADHNCCETGHGSGCSDPTIESCVCFLLFLCCDVDWDDLCAALVEVSACGSCAGPVCGNGAVETGEECDDGNTIDGDGCQGNCKAPFCGDSIIDPAEECDDGNTANGDGCDENCLVELGAGRITLDANNETQPTWDPRNETIAFVTDRPPALANGRNIGAVQADGTNEGLVVTGQNTGFGIGDSPSWVGSTGLLMMNVRNSQFIYMTFNTAGHIPPDPHYVSSFNSFPFGADALVWTRKLNVPGASGQDTGFVRVSRGGATTLWRHRTAGGFVTLHTAPFASLADQLADSIGSVIESGTNLVFGGAGLTPDGSQAVLSLGSGNGLDLFVRNATTGAPILTLTSSGVEMGVTNRDPEVSPDGLKIAFSSNSAGNFDIWIINIDGTGLTQVTAGSDDAVSPTWSPDGTRLGFARFDTGLPKGEPDNWNIYVVPVP